MAKETLFPDPEHPLATSDEAVKKQVVERIQSRRDELGYTQEDVARRWGKSQATVSNHLNDPKQMPWYECETLAMMLDASVGWLRYGGETDTLGTEEIATLYEKLKTEDKSTVSRLLRSLVGEQAVREMRHDAFKRRMDGYLKEHPEQRDKLRRVGSRNAELTGIGRAATIAKDGGGFWGNVTRHDSPYEGIGHTMLEKMNDQAKEMERLAEQLEACGMTRDELEGMTYDEMREAAK